MTTKVLFVCLGNICRSPTAEAVFTALAKKQGMTDQLEIDSAGTSGYHIGEPPDQRACAAAQQRGYDMSHLRARQVTAQDFEHFDYLLAMDNANLRDLQSNCPASLRNKISLFLTFGKHCSESEVPDPYYGGGEGFERVLDLVEDASIGLLNAITSKVG